MSHSEEKQHGDENERSERNSSGRGRGRGNRRGGPPKNRNRNQANSQKSEYKPKDRMAELASAARGVVEEKGAIAPSLAKLDEALIRGFPCAATPTNAFQYVCIDPHGYMSICRQFYNCVLGSNHRAENICSEAEFLLVMGQFFYKKMYEVQTEVLPPAIDLRRFTDYIPGDLPVPEIVHEYFKYLGVSILSNGLRVIPTCVIPQIYGAGGNFIPGEEVGWLHNGVQLNAGYHYYSYPMASLYAICHNPGAPGAQVINPQNVNGGLSAARARANLLQRLGPIGAPPNGVAANIRNARNGQFNLIGALQYNPIIMQRYFAFVNHVKKTSRFVPGDFRPTGSAVYQGWVVPIDGGNGVITERYECFGLAYLTMSEMQAVRMFQYRRNVNDPAHSVAGPGPGNNDNGGLMQHDPGSVNPPATLEFTTLTSITAMSQYYCRAFVDPPHRSYN